MRGALQNLQAWIGDADPRAGVYRLDQLVDAVDGWSVPAGDADDCWKLRSILASLRAEWARSDRDYRGRRLSAALALVAAWMERAEARG